MGDCNKIKSAYSLVKAKEDDSKTDEENKLRKDLPRFGKRHIQAICLFLSLSVALTVRAQLSVTIVAMTDAQKSNVTESNCTQTPHDTDVKGKINVIVNIKLNGTASLVTNANSTESLKGKMNFSNPKINEAQIVENTIQTVTKTIQMLVTEEESNDSTKNSTHNNNISAILVSKTETRNPSLGDNLGWSVYRTYNWPKSTQEMVTSSFFVGYTTMQLPMGVISQHYGGKLPILVALFANAVLSIITPWIAIVGWWAVCSCRLLQGMTQAAMYPGIQAMLGKWAPMSERGRLTTLIFTGSQFGTIVAFQLAGFLAGSPLGWPSSFWVSGLLSLACFVLLAALGAATPTEHPTITEDEKQYIMGHNVESNYTAKRSTPWKAILTSVPVWAMVASHAGSTFAYLFLLIEMPLYMSKILHVNIRDNGLFSSLPYIAMWTTSICMGQASDFLINHNYLSIISVRRICNSIGMMVCAFMMVAFSYAETVPLAVTLLVLSIASHAGVQTGFLINQIDLAPHFAGTLMAIANLVGNFVTLAAPLLVSFIVTDVVSYLTTYGTTIIYCDTKGRLIATNDFFQSLLYTLVQENQSQWRIVFWITAVVMLLTNAIFVVFIKVDIQPWNDLENCEDNSQELEYEKIVKVLYATPDEKKKIATFIHEEESAV